MRGRHFPPRGGPGIFGPPCHSVPKPALPIQPCRCPGRDQGAHLPRAGFSRISPYGGTVHFRTKNRWPSKCQQITSLVPFPWLGRPSGASNSAGEGEMSVIRARTCKKTLGTWLGFHDFHKITKFLGFLSCSNWSAGGPSRVPWSLIGVRGVRREASEA